MKFCGCCGHSPPYGFTVQPPPQSQQWHARDLANSILKSLETVKGPATCAWDGVKWAAHKWQDPQIGENPSLRSFLL